jgi:hypothetical protein
MRFLVSIWLCCALGAAAQTIKPQIVSKPVDGRVTVVEVRAHFVTAIRMPEAVNAVAVGDPSWFKVEHSEREPDLVFVKALTAKPVETNLLVSTVTGQETSLLLVSNGTGARNVDFVVKYRSARSFLIAPDYPSQLIGETVPVGQETQISEGLATGASAKALRRTAANLTENNQRDQKSGLNVLLARQERAPLPTLYGEHPGLKGSGGDHVKAGVSEVIDGGQQAIVLFSAVNPTRHAILLMPPQIQLGGKSRQGLLHRARWTTAEQLPVEDFRLSKRRLAPGERADGVVLFERPPYKQSNETLFLQMAEAGTVDRPALAPIGFGVNTLPEDEDGRGK